MESWCERTVRELEEKERQGFILTEEECQSLYYAKYVLETEDWEATHNPYTGEEDY